MVIEIPGALYFLIKCFFTLLLFLCIIKHFQCGFRKKGELNAGRTHLNSILPWFLFLGQKLSFFFFFIVVVYEKSCDIYWLPSWNCKQDFKIILKSRFLSPTFLEGIGNDAFPEVFSFFAPCILYFVPNTTCWLKEMSGCSVLYCMIKLPFRNSCIRKFKTWVMYFMLDIAFIYTCFYFCCEFNKCMSNVLSLFVCRV